MLHVTPICAFTDNYIWVIHDQYYAVVVDPGDALPVLNFLLQQNLKLIAILNTHHHKDHTGGNAVLLGKYSVPIYGPAGEFIPTLTHRLREGDRIYLEELSLSFSVLDIPGHTAGHIAYFGENFLFCGDTLFACGCGRLFEGTAEQMYSSLQKLAELPDATLVYCGHEYTLDNIYFAREVEPNNQILNDLEASVMKLREQKNSSLPSTIEREKLSNPFLRCNQSEVIHSASHYLNKELSDPVSVFSAIRHWKNNFLR
ncbi:MAG: hydroxyacylglutathione hydrolase [Nitrosospira sp.]|nr:hydroxyacylglutathione hydrolase [Nitrosospira sp.]